MYEAFGLTWGIPWQFNRFHAVAADRATTGDTVTVRLSDRIDPPSEAARVGPLRRVLGDTVWVRVPQVGQFRVAGTTIAFCPDQTCDPDLRDLVLAGPIANLVVRGAGLIPVHGAAVAWQGHTLLMLGAAANGTSTLAAALSLRGFEVVGDDLLAIESDGEAARVWSGTRFLQLSTDVVNALGSRLPEPRQLSRPAVPVPRWDVPNPTPYAQRRLSAIYLLDIDAKEAARVEPLRGLQRIEAVLNADIHRWVRRAQGRYSDDFAAVGCVTAPLPMRKISRLDTRSLHVGRLSKVVAADFRALVASDGFGGPEW